MVQCPAAPYDFPYDGAIDASRTALILIDMQVDFCGRGGYVAQMGYDVEATRAPIEPLRRVLAAARRANVRVIHTREGHRPSLADLPRNKRWRSRQICAGSGGIGGPGPCGRVLVRGEPGWELIPELAPRPHEDIVDKCGKGSFHATDLDMILRTTGVDTVFLGGITTDVCVHTTMREANDRGFECCIISDGTGATDAGNHAAALKMVTMQHGVFGAVAAADAVVAALDALPAPGAGGGAIEAAAPFRFAWPAKASLAVVMVDWQRDFLEPGGFGASLGNDVARLQKGVAPARRVLDAARRAGVVVVHTLEAHAPDLADCPPAKKRRCAAIGETRDASRGRVLVRGEPGNAIVPELAPAPGEAVVHKPGKGAFYATGLEATLRATGVTHLLVTGVTTEVCVQATVREANDRGFDALVVSDATESYFPEFKASTLAMLVAQGGIGGWTADSAAVCAALDAAAA